MVIIKVTVYFFDLGPKKKLWAVFGSKITHIEPKSQNSLKLWNFGPKKPSKNKIKA